MADQWNANIPAVGNQVAEDIADIKENLEHAKDAFQRIFETWSDAAAGNASAVLESSVGFSDGIYTYDFPTNSIAAHSLIMLGNSSTILWMYLNAAPPGWKVLTTGTDTVLAVSGGTEAYNENGGTTNKGDHDISVANMPAHDHTGSADTTYSIAGNGGLFRGASGTESSITYTIASQGGGDTKFRPKASVGKLYQLDTA